MKKIIITLAIPLLIAVSAHAQSQPASKQRNAQSQSNGWAVVPKSEIPKEVKATLKKSKYDGWEKAMVYKDQANGDYIVEAVNGTGNNESYRIDKNGKEKGKVETAGNKNH